MRNLFNTGRDESLIKSIEGSVLSLVTPRRVRARGFLQNGAIAKMGSRKYPMDLSKEQSCSTCPP